MTLPPGTWRHLVTGQTYEGETTLTVDAPIGTPAAFIDTAHPLAEQLVGAVGDAARGPA